MRHYIYTSTILAVILSVCTSAHAEVINWAVDPKGINKNSSDLAMADGFVFELGVFNKGFVPTPSNIAEWDENWHRADFTYYNATTREFTGHHQVRHNELPFSQGAKGWVMGTNATSTGTEIVLFRHPSWVWPAANPQARPTLNWVANNTPAMQVVVGSLNSSGSPFLMRSTVVRTYDEWSELHLAGEPLNGPNDDPAGDGVANVLKFALGMDPKDTSQRPSTPVRQAQIGNEKFMEMSISKQGINKANMLVEVSSDLQTWHNGDAFVEVVSDEQDELIVRDRTPFSGTGGKRFMRLKVDLPK